MKIQTNHEGKYLLYICMGISTFRTNVKLLTKIWPLRNEVLVYKLEELLLWYVEDWEAIISNHYE